MKGEIVFNIGLKLWSTNSNYVQAASHLYDQGLYQYIELFSVPGSYQNFGTMWQPLVHSGVPFIIHAPHSATGLNLANGNARQKNRTLIEESLHYADALHARYVIFHLGVNGSVEEAAHQLRSVYDHRMLIENKPYFGIDHTDQQQSLCVGVSPEDIALAQELSGAGFCLDLAHAVYAANALCVEPFTMIKAFLLRNPAMYHLSDGNWEGFVDDHKNLGKGTFNLQQMLSLLPQPSWISLETAKNYQDRLDDFEEDVALFHSYAGD